MITTIILALIAMATSIWALIEKYGKKALNAIIAAMNLDVDKLKGDNMTLQGLLKHEKELVTVEKKIHESSLGNERKQKRQE